MSPSSSAAIPSHVRARGSSNTTPIPDSSSIRPTRTFSRPGSPADPPRDPAIPPPHYTVFIRLPFPRGDFQDPAPTNWTALKDRQLWRLISKSHSGDLDWAGLSQEFDVDLNFLLMQAAWLSQRHMERMRRQVTRIGGSAIGEESGVAMGSAVQSGGVRMERTGSRESKLQSGSTAMRRGSPSCPILSEGSGSPITDQPQSGLPPISRTPSSTTVTQSKLTGSRIQQPHSRGLRGSSGSTRKPLPAASIVSSRDEYYEDAVEHEGHSDSNSESEDEPPSALARSQAFRRPPPTTSKKSKPALTDLASEGDEEDAGDDDDESSNGGYLPFAAASSSNPSDPAATLKKNDRSAPATATASRQERDHHTRTNTTASSQSSASSNPQQPSTSRRRASYDSSSATRPGPLSPRHRAQLASVSPQSKASAGSPSMGSSFSDLDDASVTQSALEEALMSNMRAQGGSTMASRMSSLRDALGRGSGRGLG